MGILSNFLDRAKAEIGKYKGDKTFLKAAAAAAALVIAADGVVEDTEIQAAMGGLTGNTILKGSYKASEIEDELSTALSSVKTRAGKAVLMRELEAVTMKPRELREDIFLIAADVADDGGIADVERKTLDIIAKALGIEANKLLAA